MRIASLMVLISLNVLLLCSCGKKITLNEAKEIALKDADKLASDVTFTKEKSESRLTGTEFELEFISQDGKWEYEISGDGTIMTKGMELNELPVQQQTLSQVQQSQPQSLQPQISAEQAKQIALSHAGMQESAVRMKKVELDHDDGKLVYEIEFEQGNTEW